LKAYTGKQVFDELEGWQALHDKPVFRPFSFSGDDSQNYRHLEHYPSDESFNYITRLTI
jgi:hypothetical protein